MKITPKDSSPTAEGGPTPPLFLERQGTRQYVARNARGAELLLGDGPGRFSPGDLLKIALAGCNAMSSDRRLENVLGEDFAQVVGVSGAYDKEADRFDSFQVELVQDLSSLDESARADLERRAEAAIDRNCTIGHTLVRGTPYTKTFTSEPASDGD
ncbi:OsmC family protein [Actinomyces polynesiensis]|uniref:OsmC family protein n=1 Tax=Actinomyces polynesiensis TaxID=1325934 RepID=UPI0005B8D5CC|nr:OsmC family protein [Actinomyces polynesiensis]